MYKIKTETALTVEDILERQRVFAGVIKYKTKYKGYTVYLPFINRRLTLGYPYYYLVKEHEYYTTQGFEEYEKVYDFLEAHGNEIEEKYEVGVNVFIDED